MHKHHRHRQASESLDARCTLPLQIDHSCIDIGSHTIAPRLQSVWQSNSITPQEGSHYGSPNAAKLTTWLSRRLKSGNSWSVTRSSAQETLWPVVASHVGKHAAACVMLSCFECSASTAAFCLMKSRTSGPPTTHARRHDYLHGHDGTVSALCTSMQWCNRHNAHVESPWCRSSSTMAPPLLRWRASSALQSAATCALACSFRR